MQTVIAPRGCYLVALAREVDEGEHVEVDDETAESLIEQGWTSLRSASARRPRPGGRASTTSTTATPPPTDQPAETVEES
jgi:hypothetical protein